MVALLTIQNTPNMILIDFAHFISYNVICIYIGSQASNIPSYVRRSKNTGNCVTKIDDHIFFRKNNSNQCKV